MAPATLLLIPREIRDIIYHFTFVGSRLHFGPAPVDALCRWHFVGNVELLFTCNMCYEEGRSAFWGEVVVYGYDRCPSTTIYKLSQHLSDFAKSRIRHVRRLRAVDHCANKLGLDQFPRLKTCEFIGCSLIYGGPHSELSDGDEQSWINFAASRQFLGADPHRTLEERWKLGVNQYKAEFLMRFTLVHIISFLPYRTCVKSIWVNMTTKKYFIKQGPGAGTLVEGEEGFRRVLAESPQPQAKADQSSTDLARAEDDDCADVDDF